MSWNNIFLLKILQTVLIGNYDFFNNYGFEEYFSSKFKIRKGHISYLTVSLFVLSFIISIFQMIINKILPIESILLGFISVIVCSHGLRYLIFLQFKKYSTTIETIGYFVLNELLVVLNTSYSLKEAVKFIILGNYPVFSEIFKRALLLAHFESSLNLSLRKQVSKYLIGDIQNML
ncbi:MAG: hypothetical protein ACFFE4_22155, partial [Candidatus Thorarchaeota archaeon]